MTSQTIVAESCRCGHQKAQHITWKPWYERTTACLADAGEGICPCEQYEPVQIDPAEWDAAFGCKHCGSILNHPEEARDVCPTWEAAHDAWMSEELAKEGR